MKIIPSDSCWIDGVRWRIVDESVVVAQPGPLSSEPTSFRYNAARIEEEKKPEGEAF